MKWGTDELDLIVEADDLKVAPLRQDGVSCGTPTWIWCVAVDGELFARAYHGRRSSWYQAAAARRAGRSVAAGMTRGVAFEPVDDGPIQGHIDDAYRAKYRGSAYLNAMVGAQARAATVRITPLPAKSEDGS